MRISWCILPLLFFGFVGVAEAGHLDSITRFVLGLARVAQWYRAFGELPLQWKEPVLLVVGVLIAVGAGWQLYRKSIWLSVGFVIAIGAFLLFYVPGAIERFNELSSHSVKASLNSQPNFASNPFLAEPLPPWLSNTNSVVPSAGGEYLKIAKPPQKSF
jgi:hypothetical protein